MAKRRLGFLLKERRVKAGLSMAQTARDAGVSRGFVGKVERGEGRLSLDTLVRLGKTVKCGSLADLFRAAGM